MRIGLFGNHTDLAARLAGLGVAILADRRREHPEAGPRIDLIDRLDGFFAGLEHPRLFVLDLPPGRQIDRVIDEAYV